MILIDKIITKIRRKRFEKINQFDDTNHFEKNTIINHTSWGTYSAANKNCFLNRVTIGNYVSIASNVKIGLGRHRFENFTTYHSPVLYDAVKDDEINYSDDNYWGYMTLNYFSPDRRYSSDKSFNICLL